MRTGRNIRRAEDDEGFGLVSVLMVSAVVMSLLLLLMTTSVSGLTDARRAQDAKRALAAAQAGIDEYLSRLQEDPTYWRGLNGDTTNAAFGTGRTLPGSSDATQRFRYRVATTIAETNASGVVRLTSTGTAANASGSSSVSRTLTATFSSSAHQYAYLSDLEVSSTDIMYLHTNTNCGRYWYAGRSAIGDADVMSAFDPSDCHNIPWTAADTVQGPVHSNDAIEIASTPTFGGATTSAWPAIASATKTWWGPATSVLGNRPVYAPAVTWPSGGYTTLKTYATSAGADACYYRGATRITFAGSTMSVLSPATTTNVPGCYNGSTSATRSSLQTGLPIPDVIYVDSLSSASCAASTLHANSVGFPYDTNNLTTSEKYDADVNARESPDALFGTSPLQWGWAPNYCDSRGTAYVSGQAAVPVTVGTQDDVVITGDLTVPSLTGTAMIGLWARSSVFLYHPVTHYGVNIGSPVTRVDAAIAAEQNSFILEYYSHGAPIGALTVNGSVMNKYRGQLHLTNATGTHGYSSVNLVLDARLNTSTPPQWPTQPTAGGNTAWSLTSTQDG